MSNTINSLMESCKGVVLTLARRFNRPDETWITFKELEHEATVSLWRSAIEWEAMERKQSNFPGYAWNRIRHDLQVFCNSQTELISVPRQATHERRRQLLVPTVSIDTELKGTGQNRHEFIAAEPDNGAYDADELEQVHRAMRALNADDAQLLRERYTEGRTLQSIATELGFTREAVRQREIKALRKVRKMMAGRGFN